MSKWTKVASEYCGDSGRPGSSFHTADATISRAGDRWRCVVVESWGSHQGYLEEHGRNETEGRGDCYQEAIDECRKDVLAWASEDEQWRAELATLLRKLAYAAEDALDN